MFAFGPEDLERFAIPIGIGIAILVVLLVPSLRRGLMECYKKGKEHGERLRGKKKTEDEQDDETSGHSQHRTEVDS